jgi:T5SS/PEP-CTERM-associated repeat protein
MLLIILLAITFVFGLRAAEAAITKSGDVQPTGTWTSSTPAYVGKTSNGTLEVDGGSTIFSDSAVIANSTGKTGLAIITGSGSAWTISKKLWVGSSGTGTLRIFDGGSISNTFCYLGNNIGSSGSVTVSGTNATWTNHNVLYVGYNTSGTLEIAAAGTVTSVGCYLGMNAGSTGSITISGAGSSFSSSTGCCIGNSGTGTFRIENGGLCSDSSSGLIGNQSGSIGSATVTGSDSKWNTGSLTIGSSGSGTLSIDAGGQINTTQGFLGLYAGSTGSVVVSGSDSKWVNTDTLTIGDAGTGTLTVSNGALVSTRMLYASLTSLAGDGTISISQGAILDANLAFNAAHPSQNTLSFGSGGSLTLNVNGGDLGAGYKSSGTLGITEGVTIACPNGYLGYKSGSTGTATVSGTNSSWNCTSGLYVGMYGTGTLRIQDSGHVNSYSSYLGFNAASSGTVMVIGPGSQWKNTDTLLVGYAGAGTLDIRDGGAVSASVCTVSSGSMLSFDACYGSKLALGGTSTFTNSGTLRIVAGPQPTSGIGCIPVAATTWSGSGTVQPIGGTWNSTSHVFTVSEIASGISGTAVTIDLAQKQRIWIADSTMSWSAAASFLPKTGTGKTIDFTATSISGTALSSLLGTLQVGQYITNGWNFAATGAGYSATDPIYLSMNVSPVLEKNALHVWQYQGGTWSLYSPTDLIVNDSFASFTVTGVGCFALITDVPTWKKDADGSWQTPANWTLDSAPNGANVAAMLANTITAARTISLDSPLKLGALTFNTSKHYTLTGANALTIQVDSGYIAKIDVQKSDTAGHEIKTPLVLASPLEIAVAANAKLTLSGQLQTAGNSLTLSGSGTLNVTKGISTTGSIEVLGGTLITPSLVADTLAIGTSTGSAAATVPEPSGAVLILAVIFSAVIGARRKACSTPKPHSRA